MSRSLVRGERALSQYIGHRLWQTDRVKEVLPQLRAAVGARPPLPTKSRLDRIRYTPITRRYKDAAELSHAIARREGFSSSSDPGRCEGILMDVAELWELFVLHCVRRVAEGLRVVHGTRSAEDTYLLRDRNDEGQRLGRLKPDILVLDGERTVAVIDPKYKRLKNSWPERPDGVDRSDLYQLAAYLSRHGQQRETLGMLVYPHDPEQAELANAEARGPWLTEAGEHVRFERLPVDPDGCAGRLRALLTVSQSAVG